MSLERQTIQSRITRSQSADYNQNQFVQLPIKVNCVFT